MVRSSRVRTPRFRLGNRGSIPGLQSKRKKKNGNHKSALKRIRSNEKRRVLNRYQHKTTRNAIKALRIATDKVDATSKLSNVISMIDKLAKRISFMIIKASNLKSKTTVLFKGYTVQVLSYRC
jgi:small subunit ribosomal protein S20